MSTKFQPGEEMFDETQGHGGRFPLNEEDAEGHRFSGGLVEDEDAEGHRFHGTVVEDDDVEGHRVSRAVEDDDTEGHRYAGY